ncbi:response regulator [Paenibacillus arenilitoris]|uniref:Response regulator n=1 Tax=Paenibacillus arenilitoris TaxID=2772299 RepID=A0A927CIE9_9BACL|nr:response regulator [Paenibacillus arenilitoris]MBD2867203.1 response regulator [Paenibacillus arenilitoris]
MLTIFLVEDEMIELELLRDHIDWAGMGVRVAGTAKNGRKAWEQIQLLKPDIVLTDVRMPIMDGLQLASLVQANYSWMKIVFLSGHDEFGYVKTALQAGAIGYLLKPIDRAELAAVMAKVRDEVEKENLLRISRHVLIEKRIEELYKSGGEGAEQSWKELIRIEPPFAEKRFVTALIRGDGSREADIQPTVRSLLSANAMDGFVFRLGEREWVLAVPETPGADYGSCWQALSGAIKLACDWNVTIGVADTAAALNEAHGMLREAGRAAEESFYVGHGHIIRSGQAHEGAGDVFTTEDAALLKELNVHDRSAFASGLEHYFDMLVRMRAGRRKVHEVALELLRGIDAACSKLEEQARKEMGELHDWSRELLQLDTAFGIKGYLLGLAGKFGDYLEERGQDRHLQLVREVAEHIDNAYSEPLTIEQLAAKVYISPNYLRALFKEKQGCTIHEYLTRVRLAKAVELLADRTLKIHDVARKVGYDNTSYFCSFFYKTQGVTPNEYRKKFL